MPQKPYHELEKFKFWAKNGLNLKLSLFYFLLSIQYL